MLKPVVVVFSVFLISVAAVFNCQVARASDLLPGGAATVYISGTNAYSMPSATLSITQRLDFNVGNSFFRNPWVSAPASIGARDGLGPLFNTNSCQSCHIKDGRGHPPTGPEDNAISMLVRLSVPADQAGQVEPGPASAVQPDPVYGTQLQDHGVAGVPAEGRIRISWHTRTVTFKDGETIELRKPQLEITDLQYGPLHPDIRLSPRVAPAMIGLGLLEALPDAAILAGEDPDDKDGNGISGRANRVWDIEKAALVPGRFGWKAGQPSLRQQNAAAFNGDLGLTSGLFPADQCTAAQKACKAAPHGGEHEVSEQVLQAVTFYTRHLAVPARQITDLQAVTRGKALFHEVGCQHCHRPSYNLPPESGQGSGAQDTIWPYTDLLLHDMGPELADHATEFSATGTEWRTPPLWGLSHLQAVNGHSFLLHDGRARNVLEAIIWHGGEAEQAKQAVLAMDKAARQALVTFVESL